MYGEAERVADSEAEHNLMLRSNGWKLLKIHKKWLIKQSQFITSNQFEAINIYLYTTNLP